MKKKLKKKGSIGKFEPNEKILTEALDQSGQKENKPDVKVRARNYSDEDDVQLCISWLEVSEDPLNGTDQAATQFWERVAEHYLIALPAPLRTSCSLKSRWQTVQHSVNRFNGCVTQIELANPSGRSLEDRLTMSLKLYAKLYKKPFKYLRAYNILANAPKWNLYCKELDKKNDLSKKNADIIDNEKKKKITENDDSNTPLLTTNSPVISTLNIEETSSISSVPTTPSNRPIGRHKAKDLRRKAHVMDQDQVWKENMANAQLELAAQAKCQNDTLTNQSNEIEQQSKAMQELAQSMTEESIMNKDLTGMDEDVLRYYLVKRRKIMENLDKNL